MELLVGKWHILIDALLGEATLPWVPLVWIPEYLARLMKLSDISDKLTGDFSGYLCLQQEPAMMTARSRDAVGFVRLPFPDLSFFFFFFFGGGGGFCSLFQM